MSEVLPFDLDATAPLPDSAPDGPETVSSLSVDYLRLCANGIRLARSERRYTHHANRAMKSAHDQATRSYRLRRDGTASQARADMLGKASKEHPIMTGSQRRASLGRTRTLNRSMRRGVNNYNANIIYGDRNARANGRIARNHEVIRGRASRIEAEAVGRDATVEQQRSRAQKHSTKVQELSESINPNIRKQRLDVLKERQRKSGERQDRLYDSLRVDAPTPSEMPGGIKSAGISFAREVHGIGYMLRESRIKRIEDKIKHQSSHSPVIPEFHDTPFEPTRLPLPDIVDPNHQHQYFIPASQEMPAGATTPRDLGLNNIRVAPGVGTRNGPVR
jgi:hypothetical protein